MGPIVAIGGGELATGGTLPIDREIVSLAKMKRPFALFIPTASGEPQGYIGAFHKIYSNRLRCRTGTLKILTGDASDAQLRDKILSADILYVGGGNTLEMLRVWRARGVDTALREAWTRGAVLAGLSAGSLCWFAEGHSDSLLESTGGYSVVAGLDLLPYFHCPHYDERPDADAFIAAQSRPAFAIENNCAVVFEAGGYRVVRSAPQARAWYLWNENGALQKRALLNARCQPLTTLPVPR